MSLKNLTNFRIISCGLTYRTQFVFVFYTLDSNVTCFLLFQIVGCAVFSVIVYTMSSQPLDIVRFSMFFAISLYTVLVAQSFGLMIGAVFSVVVSTFTHTVIDETNK